MLKALVEEHVAETKSPLGARLLNDWDREVEKFWQVVPKEMLSRLPQPLVDRQRQARDLSRGSALEWRIRARHDASLIARRVHGCSSPLNIVLFGLSWPMIKIGLEAGVAALVRGGRATLSATTAFALLAALGRLPGRTRADWPIVLSVGAPAARLLLRLRQSRHAEPAGRPLERAGLHRDRSGSCRSRCWSARRSAGAPSPASLLGVAGIVVLADPPRFDWTTRP